MPDVYENPFTASLLDFFENQQNARKKAPWASETPATWSDGTPIGDEPFFDAPYQPTAYELSWKDTLTPDYDFTDYVPAHGVYRYGALTGSLDGMEVPSESAASLFHEGTQHLDDAGAVFPTMLNDYMLDRKFRNVRPTDAPFYESMRRDLLDAQLLADYGIGPEKFVPELPVSKFTTDFKTDPSFLKLDSVDDALLMGSPYGADDYLAGLSSFTPGKMPVNAVDDVFDLAKSSAKAGKRAGSGLAASFRKLKNII